MTIDVDRITLNTMSSLDSLRRSVSDFMAGGEFWPLWRAVMDATSLQNLSSQDEQWFDALYDIVYMGAPDPVSGNEERDGIVAASKLRDLIRRKRLDVTT